MNIKKNIITTTLLGAVLATSISPTFANEKNIDYSVPTLYKQEAIPTLYGEEAIPTLYGEEGVPTLYKKDKIINVNIDGQSVVFPDEKPILVEAEGRTIVPVRFITQHLGGSVEWDQENKTAVLKLNDKEIKLSVNKKYALVNGEEKELDSSAKLIKNRTYVPVRFVCETFGYDVEWDKKTETINLTKKDEVFTGGSKYFDETLGLYKITGEVKNIENGKDGIMALVEGDGLYNEIQFNINNEAEIVDEIGMKLSSDDIKENSNIIVYHDAKMTRSLPPIANAKKVIVKDVYCKEGEVSKIRDIKEGKMIFIGKDMNDGIEFTVSDKTEIVNEEGIKLSIDDIKEGAKVKIYHSPIMTASLPPITNAEKIIIMSSN